MLIYTQFPFRALQRSPSLPFITKIKICPRPCLSVLIDAFRRGEKKKKKEAGKAKEIQTSQEKLHICSPPTKKEQFFL